MPCGLSDPVSCALGPVLNTVAGDAASSLASSAWNSICKSFADACTEVLKAFANAFVKIPPIDLSGHGIRSVYAISLGLASLIAALLLIGQVIRTAITHDGSALATAFVGVGKAALAFMLTLTVASTALLASDEVTKFIVESTFDSQQAFSDKISKLIAWSPGNSASLLLIFAILGILLTIVLWFEMLMRNAAIAVLIATSPISAAGQVSKSTKSWWTKLVSSTVQLIILKPIVALVFALGFGLAGDSQDLSSTLSGMLVLLLAALAWPSIARFFTFASVQVGGGAGLAGLLGFAGGRLSAGGGPASGPSPDTFGQESASRTMSSFASKGGAASGGAGAAAGGAGGAGAAAGGAAAAAGPIGMAAAAGVKLAQQAVNSLAGGMEKMAGHAGAQGANPYAAQPAGYVNRHAGSPLPTSGFLPDQPKPDWSGQQESQAEPVEPAGQQTDHQQALQDTTPDLPVTSAPRSDPPTIEMPPVSAGPPAGAAAASAAPPAGPAPQSATVPGPPLRAPQPGSPGIAPTASGTAAPAPAQAPRTGPTSGAAPLNATRPAPSARPAAIQDHAAPAPAPAPAPSERPSAPRPEAAPVERPAAPSAVTNPDQPEGGDKS
ncbi:hypothetical protein C7C46_09440 [Streptomyces tateyamensis]|uniref:Conjugal transfer protein TrbL n=1 Tax=Streptomyces tateyamensis TaxID=565073 RepID=A0A2V4NDH6_9ACTN|nr:hypothetical protein [Streptomyces tateyamensis]PYC82577.1 hypothetical protein C7C46_09440 [Streptomyces tateyamensis]